MFPSGPLTFPYCRLQGITRINPRSFFISPDFQMWLVNSYFALRGEMYRIGMASNSRPLQCPVNISSGIHGVWLAFQVRETRRKGEREGGRRPF